MNKFNVTLKYENKEKPAGCSHKLNRTLVETYEAVPESDMVALMTEMLDLPFDMVDNKRVVVEPSIEKLQKNLGPYVQDEKFLKSELKRQKKAYEAFGFVNDFIRLGCGEFKTNLSENEKLFIERLV